MHNPLLKDTSAKIVFISFPNPKLYLNFYPYLYKRNKRCFLSFSFCEQKEKMYIRTIYVVMFSETN